MNRLSLVRLIITQQTGLKVIFIKHILTDHFVLDRLRLCKLVVNIFTVNNLPI